MKTKDAFWDSSVIVPLCCRQAVSSPLRKLWGQMNRAAVWWGAPVEVRSALSRLTREGAISTREYAQALARLTALRASWREVMPGEKVRELSESLLDMHPIRALDAFQLAAALVWCLEKPHGRLFVCADHRLREAAERAGFTVLP